MDFKQILIGFAGILFLFCKEATNFYRGRWGQGGFLIQSFHLTCMFYLQVHTDYYIICGVDRGIPFSHTFSPFA
jgi:hypothetical protein